MQNFFEWFEARQVSRNHPWLIFGKGPSFSQRGEYDLSQYHTLAINHAVREQTVMVAHMIDYETVEACGATIELNAEALVMPWVPHVKLVPGAYNLAELIEQNATLRRMNEQGRLLWYDLRMPWYDLRMPCFDSRTTQPQPQPGGRPVVQALCNSAEAALNLLAHAGVRRVRSLGVDGGTTYSPEFEDLKATTLLANGAPDYDSQFKEIEKIIAATGIDYAPLGVPVRIYVGATETQMLPVKVLEYSIRKHASVSIEVLPLYLSNIEIPQPRDAKNRPYTQFSFQRFLIPAVAGYRGRAIYLDSDMQVFKDIRQLWTLPFNEAELLAAREPSTTGRRPQFSVMLLNCDALKWDINVIVEALDRGELSYEQLMSEMAVAKNVRAEIDPVWNSLERFEEGKTALLHYTDVPTQPWLSPDNPLGHLWVKELIEAIDNDFITLDYVEEQVRREHVRPSLLYQIEYDVTDSCGLNKARLLDRFFVRPSTSAHKQELSLRSRAKKFLYVTSMYGFKVYKKPSLHKLRQLAHRL